MPARWSPKFALVLLASIALPASAKEEADWKVVKTSDGVEVSMRDEPGRELPALRGRTTLQGDVLHVLAIVLDVPRTHEWVEGATGARVLERKGALPALIYAWSDLSWPVSDRDVISRLSLQVDVPGKEYRILSSAEPDYMPAKDGMIRIRTAFSEIHLREREPGRVWIEYTVNVDPGGSLPSWLIRWASKSVPVTTLKSLQTQVDHTRTAYTARIAELKRATAPAL